MPSKGSRNADEAPRRRRRGKERFSFCAQVARGEKRDQMAKSMKKRQEICPLETLVRNSPAAGRAEAGDISLILRLKRALRRHLAVKTVRRLKAYIEAVSDFFEKRKA